MKFATATRKPEMWMVATTTQIISPKSVAKKTISVRVDDSSLKLSKILDPRQTTSTIQTTDAIKMINEFIHFSFLLFLYAIGL